MPKRVLCRSGSASEADGCLYTRFSLDDSAFPLSGLINNVSDNVPVISSPIADKAAKDLLASKAAKKAADKLARDLKNKNAKAAKALVAVVLPPTKVVPGAAGSAAGVKLHKVCASFHSTAGCVYAGSCNRVHGNPPVKNSADWLAAEAFMKLKSLTPTVAFSQ